MQKFIDIVNKNQTEFKFFLKNVFPIVMKWEGGGKLHNVPSDPGGNTIFGIDYKKNKQLCLTQKFHVHAREDFLDEDEIALFLKAGLDINTWGVKNRFRYAYFKEKGVNIVIANKNFKKLKM